LVIIRSYSGALLENEDHASVLAISHAKTNKILVIMMEFIPRVRILDVAS
jgi:hypothetical protein